MENYNEKYSKDLGDDSRRGRIEPRSGRVAGGLIIVAVGLVFLADRFGADIPHWIFTWKTLLIAIGLFVGVRHRFRGFAWLILIMIGGSFMIEEFVPNVSFHQYIWPLMIIFFGLFMIFRPRHMSRRGSWGQKPEISSDDEIDATSIFGGTKKNIITKDFRGGDITTFFGGTELNFMQADIKGTVAIDVTQVFGGTKLLVPPHWNIKSEVVCMFGAIEDKRPAAKEEPDPTKVLLLQGTCIFGGIDIKSY